MYKSVLWLLCATIISTQAELSMWEFAVTTDSKIYFYDENWKEVTAAGHQFEKLSAIAFDETEEIIYFNDQQLKHNGSIFSLKLSLDADPTAASHAVEKVVLRTTNETITSIAYDPLNRNLFWIDAIKRVIFFKSIDSDIATPAKVLIDFAKDTTKPDSIAIDVCRRKLYWTNSNPENATVERIDLDGTLREVIVSDNLHRPHGIVVDQLSDRIYWVVDLPGIHFKVESAKLDGTDRIIVYKGMDITPFNLAVTKNKIFWTGSADSTVWSFPKLFNKNISEQQTEAAEMKAVRPNSTDNPRGIVVRTGFFTNLQNDQHCANVVTKIKSRLLTPKPTKNPVDIRIKKMRQQWCLNGGEYSESDTCVCQIGYKGVRCEVNECHNFCVHGTCVMSELGFPACTCQKGFYGTRCQSERCLGYCLNEGSCKLDSEGVPSCYCPDNFGGERCAHKLNDIALASSAQINCKSNYTEICTRLCEVFKYELSTPSCHELCQDLELSDEEGVDIDIYSKMMQKYARTEVQQCGNGWNGIVVIVLVCGVVTCLGIVLLIINGLRRFYKPARPRIKKTFVVRKQASSSSDTPLTNRPMATEQCEITIENCCNMNICDTPCFDPKLVQATLARNDNLKEDKKMLVHSMEDDLY